MKEYYIKFISKTLKDAIELAEKLWYSMIYGYTNPRSFVWDWILALDKSWFYFTSTRDEKTLISYWFKELKLYDKLEPWTKVEIISNHIWTKWNICTINYCIDDCFDEDMWYLYSLKEKLQCKSVIGMFLLLLPMLCYWIAYKFELFSILLWIWMPIQSIIIYTAKNRLQRLLYILPFYILSLLSMRVW